MKSQYRILQHLNIDKFKDSYHTYTIEYKKWFFWKPLITTFSAPDALPEVAHFDDFEDAILALNNHLKVLHEQQLWPKVVWRSSSANLP